MTNSVQMVTLCSRAILKHKLLCSSYFKKDNSMMSILSPNQVWIIVDPKLSFFFPIIR
ncbi:TPA: tryptophanase leader peptide [Pasteurella multocida]|nr:tryptophanase leader peptide [Pasteurella multocida]